MSTLEKMDDFFNARAEGYDEHMLGLELNEFYEEISHLITPQTKLKLLDLGCGTGTQLCDIIKQNPDIDITGIDMSKEMLSKLKTKYSQCNINLVCDSYFNVDFGVDKFDYIISTYSLHHFSEEKKVELYKRIFKALRLDGTYIEGDYTAQTIEKQRYFIQENKRIRQENCISDEEFYHYDIPFTADTQIKLYKTAGFKNIKIIREWENTTIFMMRKQ